MPQLPCRPEAAVLARCSHGSSAFVRSFIHPRLNREELLHPRHHAEQRGDKQMHPGVTSGAGIEDTLLTGQHTVIETKVEMSPRPFPLRTGSILGIPNLFPEVPQRHVGTPKQPPRPLLPHFLYFPGLTA